MKRPSHKDAWMIVSIGIVFTLFAVVDGYSQETKPSSVGHAHVSTASAETTDFSMLAGEWVRNDGDYKLNIQKVTSEGSVVVGYFNPERILVSEASVSLWKGLVKLFVKLQDKGYPGSTYTVYYYAEKDALAGYYYQAEMKQTFRVIFFRNPDP